jgi:hypothetical protein
MNADLTTYVMHLNHIHICQNRDTFFLTTELLSQTLPPSIHSHRVKGVSPIWCKQSSSNTLGGETKGKVKLQCFCGFKTFKLLAKNITKKHGGFFSITSYLKIKDKNIGGHPKEFVFKKGIIKLKTAKMGKWSGV